ncbi:DBR1-domain-containing protein [Gloeophyllum trabeum ATCC 11539]|uniref:DBR1-domain-containing protein n=1 Tax=Gloeophyllum trabeum (strain ATCC 11539 / FP-39264 / Madison 617) TaxID=670483 RepID=S7PTH4_GLOTA|nr:DBR1-domain-containing protein [Gloeophyllum trabeum ATCC 11539]EPQ50728.1 DBR1-domain-containing protein [Gloeophyllum trabeum ATCC 11539]
MKIAVEGCCHGELDNIYQEIARLEQQNHYKVDLLLICGDFQAIRNHRDLTCMAVPDKYKRLGGFHKYYTGEKTAPVLTIFIGGNHEASNYLWELYHGGWVAPNIYYLGHAGCVHVNGVRIAGHYEHLPYDKGTMRTIYHIREFNVRRLSLLSSPDIFLSHDWPSTITAHGDAADLLRRKPFFRDDISSGKLGSPPLMGLLRALKPAWWFAAHLHCRFEAAVVHGGGEKVEKAGKNPDEIVIDEDEEEGGVGDEAEGEQGRAEGKQNENPDEIVLDDEAAEVVAPPRPPAPPKVTTFIALDKCLPRRQFLEVVDVGSPQAGDGAPRLAYDPEWLAITRAFQPWLSTSRSQPPFPEEAQAREMVRAELAWVQANVGAKEVGECQVFAVTAPGPSPEDRAQKNRPPPVYPNPQTDAFCAMLGIENKVRASAGRAPSKQADPEPSVSQQAGPESSAPADAGALPTTPSAPDQS